MAIYLSILFSDIDTHGLLTTQLPPCHFLSTFFSWPRWPPDGPHVVALPPYSNQEQKILKVTQQQLIKVPFEN